MSKSVNIPEHVFEELEFGQFKDTKIEVKRLIDELYTSLFIQDKRIAELEAENERLKDTAGLAAYGWYKALDAVLELPIWNSLLLEVPAVIVNDAKREVEKLREATDEGMGHASRGR